MLGLGGFLKETAETWAHHRHIQMAGANDPFIQMATLALTGRDTTRHVIVVLPHAKDLRPWLTFFDHAINELRRASSTNPHRLRGAALLPSCGVWGTDRFINRSFTRAQRLYALSRLVSDEPSIIVTTISALAQTTLDPATFRSSTTSIATGQEIDQDALVARLIDLGYTPATTVEEENTYALRGSILDVFPSNHASPVRVDFLGDTIRSIREFSTNDQRSTTPITSIVIAPAIEASLPMGTHKDHVQTLYNTLLDMDIERADRDGMMAAFSNGTRFPGFDMFLPLYRPSVATALDYIDVGRDIIVFPRAVEPCVEQWRESIESFENAATLDIESKRPLLPVSTHFVNGDAAALGIDRVRWLEFGNPFSVPDATVLRLRFRPSIEGAPATHKGALADHFAIWADLLEGVLRRDGRIAILAHTDSQIERIVNLLTHRRMDPVVVPDLTRRLLDGQLDPNARVMVGHGDLAGQLWLEDLQLLVIPETTLFGETRRRQQPPSAKLQNYLTSFRDLKPGDLVVHVQHGIGRYQGMTTMTVGGGPADFLLLEYGGGDKIYLPVDRLSLLQRYNAGGESSPASAVDRLGGPAWERRKDRVRKAVRDMADELLKIQAERAVAETRGFPPASDMYYAFEAEFPFEETDDQLRAISEVNVDLSGSRPMDRLVCGDVGFGKTEVALRAVFRAISEGFQALVLVPTTVLCYQHFRTFRDRMRGHGIRVAQVSRFVKGNDLKDAVQGLETGRIDVLVGTHRLLSEDIRPRRLGLLVIDEEQRFGVAHKEKLKSLKAGVPTLTLTATPIPRTLHMSMIGLKDISIIATPPQDRLAVKTYFTRFDESLVRDAIRHEIARGGQVFFVHNRVEDIEEIRAYLSRIVPEADIRVGHGQMREGALEKVIIDFLEQRFQVLVCTTIIESGIDMPHVNTLIVNNADNFGLAQLYQIRGRVGRSTAQAYCYFFVGANKKLSDDAHRRLEILSSHQELGAGFQIASYDLEMRGAGNLLGGEQSGHMAAVGLEMYTEMLESAIQEIRGKPVKKSVDTEIKINVSALIPTSYITSENLRLQFYKSLFSARDAAEIDNLRREAQDRFGQPPAEFARLLRVATLKQQLRRCNALTLTSTPRLDHEIKFAALGEAQIDALMRVVREQPERYQLMPDYKLLLRTSAMKSATGGPSDPQEAMLTQLSALVDPLAHKLGEKSHDAAHQS